MARKTKPNTKQEPSKEKLKNVNFNETSGLDKLMLPIEESEYNFSEEEPLGGIFRENTIVEGINIREAKEIARNHGASLVVIINSEYNFEIKETSNL